MLMPAALALLAAAALGRESVVLIALFAFAGLCLFLHLAAYRALRLAPLLVFLTFSAGIAEGVIRFLPWAQPWIEGKAGDLLAPAKTARAGLSLNSRLGEVEELALSPEISLRVWSDRPQYLRARVYRTFNGRVWGRGAETDRRPMTPAPALDAELARWLEELPGTTWAAPPSAGARPQIRSRILPVERPQAGALLAPVGVEYVRLLDKSASIDASGVMEPWGRSQDLYAVVNHPSQPAAAPDADCLDTSGVVDPRLAELASRLGLHADPEERVRRTLSFLGTNCTYSLGVGKFVSQDPVSEFVFDKRRGYCEYFASAAALLLRMEGVPTRYVVGYSVRPENLEGGHYVVREADAHAWVEAWLEGRGWVELDPTPAAQFEAMRKPIRGGAVAGLWERMEAWFALLKFASFPSMLRQLAPPALIVAGLLGVAGLLYRGRGLFRRVLRQPRAARAEPDPVPPGLRDLMKRLDRHWKRSGQPRPPSRAPLEHLLGMPESARTGRELVHAVYRWRYGGRAPSAPELEALRREHF
jgi:transglutaminase-like putative cysteine protease